MASFIIVSLTRYDPVETIMNSGPRIEAGMKCMGSGDQTSVAAAMGHQLAVIQTGIGGREPSMQAAIDRPVTHFISPIAFLYQRHIPAIGSQVRTE
ncbi:hypothetical protein MesoLj113a_47910 [Mesorhizobium sp. 113-1-2]|nr:hypothetical protein MesoLj113a_47910 [Mesorhizobium sp. 113-1-2]